MLEIAFAAWINNPFYRPPQSTLVPMADVGEQFLEALHSLEDHYYEGLASSGPWSDYKRNLQAFTLHVGCPKSHDNPEENIAELRLFNSTQMPFFQKLQDDLKTQTDIINKQQEIITAVVFRHLIEQLPERTENENSTDAWQRFWTRAITREMEYPKNMKHNHPLGHVHNILTGSLRVKIVNGKVADSIGRKGLLFQTGQDLFSTLSSCIHMYNGTTGGEYAVADGQWGTPCRELLRALAPINFKDGRVDWVAERERYLK